MISWRQGNFGLHFEYARKDDRITYWFYNKKFTILFTNFRLTYPVNPKLCYRYPAPTVGILTNIINSLASSPRFYTQVLHLMNKLNLPAPFGIVTQAPPLVSMEYVFVNIALLKTQPVPMVLMSNQLKGDKHFQLIKHVKTCNFNFAVNWKSTSSWQSQ